MSFVDLPLGSLTPEDVQADRMLHEDLMKKSNDVLGTGGVCCPLYLEMSAVQCGNRGHHTSNTLSVAVSPLCFHLF